MQVTVKGMHLNVGDSLRTHIEDALNATAAKYVRDPIESVVTVTKERHSFRTAITIRANRGTLLEAEYEADDPYVAFDAALSRIGTRLRKYKDKIRDHHRTESTEDLHTAAYTTFSTEDEAEGGNEPAVIAEMELPIQTLAVADAVMQLELRDLAALVFKNPANGSINVVYRRKDGNIGWVDPAASEKPAARRKEA